MGQLTGASFEQDVREIIKGSRDLSLEHRNAFITSNHLLIAAIDHESGRATAILQQLGVAVDQLRSSAEAEVRAVSLSDPPGLGNVPLTPEAEAVMKRSVSEAASATSPTVGVGHLLLAMVSAETCEATVLLAGVGVTDERLRDALS